MKKASGALVKNVWKNIAVIIKKNIIKGKALQIVYAFNKLFRGWDDPEPYAAFFFIFVYLIISFGLLWA